MTHIATKQTVSINTTTVTVPETIKEQLITQMRLQDSLTESLLMNYNSQKSLPQEDVDLMLDLLQSTNEKIWGMVNEAVIK